MYVVTRGPHSLKLRFTLPTFQLNRRRAFLLLQEICGMEKSLANHLTENIARSPVVLMSNSARDFVLHFDGLRMTVNPVQSCALA